MFRIIVIDEVDEQLNRGKLRIIRTNLRDILNPFEVSDNAFRSFYRLPKILVQNLITELEPFLLVPQRSTAISHHLQVLAFLSVVANGGYQKNVGHDFLLSLSQTSISRCVDVVANAIDEHLCSRYIEFPQNRADINAIKNEFYNNFEFPGIIGAIDCTHITIEKPRAEVEHAYYSGRKKAHTKNVQLVQLVLQKMQMCPLFVFHRP